MALSSRNGCSQLPNGKFTSGTFWHTYVTHRKKKKKKWYTISSFPRGSNHPRHLPPPPPPPSNLLRLPAGNPLLTSRDRGVYQAKLADTKAVQQSPARHPTPDVRDTSAVVSVPSRFSSRRSPSGCRQRGFNSFFRPKGGRGGKHGVARRGGFADECQRVCLRSRHETASR